MEKTREQSNIQRRAVSGDTGLAAGLAFFTKLPWRCLFCSTDTKKTPQVLCLGALAGLLPLAIFFLWNPVALVNNAFLFHLVKEPDSTNLYTITPPGAPLPLPAGPVCRPRLCVPDQPQPTD
jgi:hypothetical protein